MIIDTYLEYITIAIVFSAFGASLTLLYLKKIIKNKSLQYKQLLKELYWYKKALDTAGVGVYKWNSSNNKWYWSSTLFNIRGLKSNSKSTAIKEFIDSIHPEDKGRVLAQTTLSQNNQNSLTTEYRYMVDSTNYRWHKEIASIIHDDFEKSDVLFGTVFDITEEKSEKEKLDFYAHYDSLTKAPNRAAFDRKLNELVKECNNSKQKLFCAFIDLNGFKLINDNFGHQEGDKVLMQITSIFLEKIPDNTYFFRLGGDEFAILLISSERELDKNKLILSSYINDSFEHFNVDRAQKVGGAVGVSIYPIDSHSSKELLSNADSAMYSAKRSGNFLVIYDYIGSGE